MAGEVGGVGAVNSYVPVSNEVDLATLMFTVQSERATLLDGMVRNQASNTTTSGSRN